MHKVKKVLKKLLIEIDSGCTSVCTLAENLCVEKEVVLGQLKTLIQQGYLSVQDKQRCNVCSKGCTGCGMSEAPNQGVTIFITEKGRKLLGKTE